ncbi:MAG: carbohydrate ABC transporter permease [Paenibacillaceae bacterium]|nr:carbohydrate ABC transporter permease [Paenibacillaceae bacterium]
MQAAGSGIRARVALAVVRIALALFFLFPLLTALSSSLHPWSSLPTLLPNSFEWQNYRFATTMIAFWRYLGNSALVVVVSVAFSTFTSGLVGYAFSRLQAPGRKPLFMIVLSTMMLPSIVTQIPLYILLHKFGLLNSFVPFWIMWGVGGSALSIFLYRQFFAAIPKELEEAARIDGCSIFGTYWRIFLPLSVPAMITVTMINFQERWGDSITPFMFLSEKKYTLAAALSNIGYTVDGNIELIIQEVTAAGSLLFLLPVLALFFVGQRYMLEGTVSAGIKG